MCNTHSPGLGGFLPVSTKSAFAHLACCDLAFRTCQTLFLPTWSALLYFIPEPLREGIHGGCQSLPSASRDFGLSLPGECGDAWAFGGSSLAFLSPRNQSSFGLALASFQNGNWMPIISLLDECPTYSSAVGTVFLLLSLSPLFLHPCELCGCGEGCNIGLWIPSVSKHLECAALLCESGLPHWVQLTYQRIKSLFLPEALQNIVWVLGMWWYDLFLNFNL